MTRGPDSSQRLARAIECAADDSGLSVTVGDCVATPWASATFAGARHRVVLCTTPSARLEAWLAALPEADLPMKDHLVADLAVISSESSNEAVAVTLEVLTVEER